MKTNSWGSVEDEAEAQSGPSPISAESGALNLPFSEIGGEDTADFGTLFNFGDGQPSTPENVLRQPSGYPTSGLLGVPPPGMNMDFLTHRQTPLPFALTADYTTQPNVTTRNSMRNGFDSLRKVTTGRATPYKRREGPNPPQSTDAFSLFSDTDLLSSKMHSTANKIEPSVGVNPAQLLTANAFDVTKTPAAARTLYGTELEGDTRFGEYGIEGIAKGFWKAPGFQY